MNYRQLGSTGLKVSEIGFGGWPAGGAMHVSGGVPLGWSDVTDQGTLEALRCARARGINFFDTADIYGHGRSESLIGLATHRHREEVVIATKVGLARTAADQIEKNFSKRHILRAIDGSLHRLRTDYVDLYQLHNPSLTVLEQGEAQEALEMLQTSGKIRYWGITVMSVEDGMEIIRRGWGYTLQLLFNILNQRAADELLPMAKQNSYGVIARVPLASGLLSGKYRSSTKFPPNDVRQNFLTPRRLSEALERVDEVKSIVGRTSETLIEAALRFVLAHEEISTTIPGVRSRSQVEQNAAASGSPLPAEVVKKLRDRLGSYNFYERHAIGV
ncbi:MAG: aldo/keto reductase [Acidobacteria bacterium]|nr:aldo/keto reductase [Acidobacteriota bacterium]